MRIKKIKILSLLLLCILSLQGQTLIKETQHLKALNTLHSESIYIHYNSSLLLAGEQLYYSLYCINKNTNKKSTFSRIAYVELVGKDGLSVFKHKIRLNEGIGQGDFFIPTSVSSGNYKLIAYTQWMRNDKIDQFFIGDLDIVNPFQKNQSLLLDKEQSAIVDSVMLVDFNNKIHSSNSRLKNKKILEDKTVFNKREKVKLSLDNILNEKGSGIYSISVRKLEAITAPKMLRSDEFLVETKNDIDLIANNDSIYLPELRGELLYGKVRSKGTNVSVSNVTVALSIPGKDHVLKIVKTNQDGVFYYNLNKSTDQQNAYLHIFDEQREAYEISMGKNGPLKFTNLSFNKLLFSPKMAQSLVGRSIHNQIENAYLDVKQDTLSPIFNTEQFYQKYDYVYDLDDYTRFTTITEVMLEVVDHAWTTKNSEGKRILQIQSYENTVGEKDKPLVLVDGLLLVDHDGILNLDARKVKKIGVKLHKYKFGPKTYNGILAFETVDGTFSETYKNEQIVPYGMFNPLAHKTYFKQKYSNNITKVVDPLPDFRHQLLWLPSYKLNQNSKSIDFYTSDVIGNYEIVIEGITDNAELVSIRSIFIVQ